MTENGGTLTSRREFLFLYDIKMGNPNGDPDENRPRVLPDGTHYVTDVRLKRFIRDFLKHRGKEILVDTIEGKTTNLTGRVVHYLKQKNEEKADGSQLVSILLDAFIDARLFGSSFAFKAESEKTQPEDENPDRILPPAGGKKAARKWEPAPKTMTGAVQINMGEVLHQAEEVDIHGTSIFASGEEKTQGTFTTYFGLRYAMIGFSGVANEHSAKISHLSDRDYAQFLRAMWFGVRSSGNTRTKVGQIPRLLVNVEYKSGEEFQFGRLHDYVRLTGTSEKPAKEWSLPSDYAIDLSLLMTRLNEQHARIQAVSYEISPDVVLATPIPADWKLLDIENSTD